MRSLWKEELPDEAGGFDISCAAYTGQFPDKTSRIIGMFQYLFADHIIELLVCKRQFFGICLYESLVGINTNVRASMGVLRDEFVCEDMRSEIRVVSGTDFEDTVGTPDMQAVLVEGFAGSHDRRGLVAEHLTHLPPFAVVGGGLDAEQMTKDEVNVVILKTFLFVCLPECGA